jgi:hypothetical protein
MELSDALLSQLLLMLLGHRRSAALDFLLGFCTARLKSAGSGVKDSTLPVSKSAVRGTSKVLPASTRSTRQLLQKPKTTST